MAKKSEELIENSATLPSSKPNLKVSKKTKSSPVSEPISIDTTSVDSISTAQEAKTETKQKRTIRININKKQNDQKVTEEIKVEETKVANKPKRTLKLNLPEEPVITPERPKITEISINQNASFFYTPSVFEKFSISVTDENEIPEEVIETEPEAHDEIDEIEVETISATDVYDFESNDVFDIDSIAITPIEEEQIEETVEGIDEDSEDESLEELIQEALEEVTETVGEEIIEESELESDEDEIVTEEDIENFFKDDSEEDSSMEELIKELSKDEQDPVEDLEAEEIDEDISPISDESEESLEPTQEIEEALTEEELLNTDDALLEALLLEGNDENIVSEESEDMLLDAIDEELLQEAADNIDLLENNVEHSDSKKNIIGKFFDSSIPSMVENGEAYFSKIKKSIFSNMSNVFKKFSYDEAELVKTASEQYEKELAVPEQTVSEIVQNLGTAIAAEFPINNVDVQADPVATIAVPTIEEALLSSTPNVETGMDELYTNIITAEANTTESVNIDDELLEEALLNEFTFEDSEEVEEVAEEVSIEEPVKEAEEEFDIEAYFGLNDKKVEEKMEEPVAEVAEVVEEIPVEETITEQPTESFDATTFENTFLGANDQPSTEELISKVSQNMNPQDLSSLSQLLSSFNNTISTLSERIASLENGTAPISKETTSEEETNEELSIDDLELSDLDLDEFLLGDSSEEGGLEFNDNGFEESVEEPSLMDDFDAFQFEDIVDELSLEDIEEATEEESNIDPTLSVEDIVDETTSEITDILSKAFSNENSLIDDIMKKELLSEVLSVESEEQLDSEEDEENKVELVSKDANPDDRTYDFLKIIDSLSKTISELERAPDIEPKEVSKMPTNPGDGKAINILINKDDIFSISILNETYEIVADFDGISVLSENIHISTPKHNFYVQVGDKYIEIHNKGTYFTLDTSFEDIEFANAINNVTFAKKNNKIELSIKDAFKLSSVNNKVELSMLNKAVANLAKASTSTSSQIEDDDNDSSVCDNKTLLISEETQKVYLPYTIDEVMRKLNNNTSYKSIEDVVDSEYTLPLSTFKMPIISRFKEAYRFMRVKEKSSVYAALDLALELMFNSNLNPAVIRAAKDLKELNIYLDCLYENEIEKFDCFKIIYKVLPKIQ